MSDKKNKVDKILGLYREADVVNLTAAPSGKKDGYLAVVNDTLYYFSNGHRYKLTATLDDPTSTLFVGANAALSLLGP